MIAYLNRTWTGIHIWVGVVTGLILPMYFLIPESVRWLAQNSKEDEAMDALLRIAKINGKNLSTDDKTKVYNQKKIRSYVFYQNENDHCSSFKRTVKVRSKSVYIGLNIGKSCDDLHISLITCTLHLGHL